VAHLAYVRLGFNPQHHEKNYNGNLKLYVKLKPVFSCVGRVRGDGIGTEFTN
jgi:hypothetical protein